MELGKSFTLILLLLISGFFSSANACPKTDCIRIGTWNLEWFGSENRSQPVDKKTINGIVDLIANQLSIDVIALQEINTEFKGTVRGEHYSQKPWQDLQQAFKDNGYQIQTGYSGYAQHIVIAWRAPVTLIEHVNDIPVPDHYDLHKFCRSANLRKPLAGEFRAGQFDFWLVGLHLKANGPDAKCSSALRKAQTRDLEAALKPLTAKDPDVILIGDFNTSSRNASIVFRDSFQALDDKANRSSSSNTHSYHSENSKKNNSGGLIDHIMVQANSLYEWQAKSTTVYKPEDAKIFCQTFSDHVPLWADFYTRKKDDD